MTASWPIIASTTKSDLVGLDGVADVGGLLHQVGVDAEPAGGVDDDHVVQRAPGLVDAATGRQRPGRRSPLPGSGANTVDTGLLADHLQLGDGVRPLQVARRQAAGMRPWSFSQRPSLPASVVLPAPCRPASMITVGGVLANRSRRVSPPRIAMSSSLTILMTCWAGLRASLTSAPRRALLDRRDERPNGGQRDVGLEQRDPDLAGGGVDVGFGEPTLATEVLERGGETVLQSVEHDESLRSVSSLRFWSSRQG